MESKLKWQKELSIFNDIKTSYIVEGNVYDIYPYVGRFHCELNFKNGEWYVKDLDSRGGTRINGSLIDKETVLKQGDLLSIANAHFEVILR